MTKLASFSARAVTVSVDPGSERANDDGTLTVRDRTFTDRVRCEDPRIDGVNEPTVSLEIDPAAGSGTLTGTFVLTPEGLDGRWEGALDGALENGLVVSRGLARGSGALEGLILRVDFTQLAESPTDDVPEGALAFFSMAGAVLE